MVNEYYPISAGEYLRRKKKLIETAKEDRKNTRKFLSKDELF